MNKIVRLLTAAALVAGSLCAFGCSKDDEKEEQPVTPSTVFAFHYDGATIAANDTVVMSPTVSSDLGRADFIVENKTEATVQACLKMECVEGRVSDRVELCYNENCREVPLGTVTDPFPIESGMTQANTITYDYNPSTITSTTVYRLTIGEGSEMKNPQVIFIKHTI